MGVYPIVHLVVQVPPFGFEFSFAYVLVEEDRINAVGVDDGPVAITYFVKTTEKTVRGALAGDDREAVDRIGLRGQHGESGMQRPPAHIEDQGLTLAETL